MPGIKNSFDQVKAARKPVRFSIVTVCYNSAATIRQALESVFGQAFTGYEYILVDGGSTDGTLSYIESVKERLAYFCSEADGGIYDAMNKAVRQARGEYVFFLGADDSLASPAVLQQVDALLAGENCDILCGRVFAVDEGYSGLQRTAGGPLSRADVFSGAMPPHQAMFVRRACLGNQPFSPGYRFAADFAFFLRAVCENRKISYVPLIVSFYSTGGQSSAHAAACYREYMDILEKAGVEKNFRQRFYNEKLRFLSVRLGLKRLLKRAGMTKKIQQHRGYEQHSCCWKSCRWCSGQHQKKRLVISGINMVSGGILSILRDCISASRAWQDEFELILLVHKKSLVADISGGCTILEYPWSKKSWFLRCFYEYVYFYFLSRRLKPWLWLSLHDMTPLVKAEHQAVYCHNAAPFYHLKPGEYLLDKKFTLFTWFYRYLYRLGIGRNELVIVQQNWLRRAFEKMYPCKRVIAARPELSGICLPVAETDPNMLFYPAFPRIFKNIELLCQAMEQLLSTKLYLVITVSGTENAYAKKMAERYGHLKNVFFAGMMSREEVFACYAKAGALVFPSRLETWGLPLSEFAGTGKPVLAADLPYARETLAGYKNACFFDPENPEQLVKELTAFAKGRFQPAEPAENAVAADPVIEGWQELFTCLLKKNQA